MKVLYSKRFLKSATKLSGKLKDSLQRAILEVKSAQSIDEITDCKKLVTYNSIYRIRIGDYRAFFVCHIEIEDGIVTFELLLPRGQAYAKDVKEILRGKDMKR